MQILHTNDHYWILGSTAAMHRNSRLYLRSSTGSNAADLQTRRNLGKVHLAAAGGVTGIGLRCRQSSKALAG